MAGVYFWQLLLLLCTHQSRPNFYRYESFIFVFPFKFRVTQLELENEKRNLSLLFLLLSNRQTDSQSVGGATQTRLAMVPHFNVAPETHSHVAKKKRRDAL